MEIVVLHSDIARLVLGYLTRQRLERASHLFCKSSPHLRQEFTAFKKGLMAHSFFPDLEEIICEYVKISRKVEQILPNLPTVLSNKLQGKKLSDKVRILFELSTWQQDVESDSVEDTSASSVQSDKENTKHKTKISEKRKHESTGSSNDEQFYTLHASSRKRRRILQPFCFLSHKRSNKVFLSEESSQSELDNSKLTEELSEKDVPNEKANSNDVLDISIAASGPRQESTPQSQLQKCKRIHVTPTDLSNAILDNDEFRKKLVDNINQALLTQNADAPKLANCKRSPSAPKDVSNSSASAPTTTAGANNATNVTADSIPTIDLLDRMVKTIIEATEKDPSFDRVIEEVLEVSSKEVASAGVQCNIESATSISAQASVGHTNSTMPGTMLTNTNHCPMLPFGAMISASCSDADAAQALNTALQTQPRTPLIIRTAIGAAGSGGHDSSANASANVNANVNANGNGNNSNSSSNNATDAHNITAYPSNASFGSLIDPNFSISKLIVLNSNESAQKQQPESQISNLTAENLLNQLSEGPVDDQVYIDPTAGHITFPLYLTNDGLLTNFPFLLNNELITQQLQPDNFANLDASRIEIPLPEPITISADQLPPNSIIVNSAQKAVTEEEQQQVTQRTVTKACKSSTVTAPHSLDAHLLKDGTTPSTHIASNLRVCKSLSTPRKRNSHVRTLTFSPKTLEGDAKAATGNTQSAVESKQEFRTRAQTLAEAMVEQEANLPPLSTDRPIINNVQILPNLGTALHDASANESSNSCGVPPFFGADESNQTVIKNDLNLKTNTSKVANPIVSDSSNSTSNTPKGRQLRRAAIRGCKRRISKSPLDQEEPSIESQLPKQTEAQSGAKVTQNLPDNETTAKENGAPVQKSADAKEQSTQSVLKDKEYEEWLRLRHVTTKDLDARLREINAQSQGVIVRNVSKKSRTRRRKTAEKKRKEIEAAVEEFEKSFADNHNDNNNEHANGSNREKEGKRKTIKATIVQKTMAVKAKVRIKPNRTMNRSKSKQFNIKIPTPVKSSAEKAKEREKAAKHSSPEAKKATNKSNTGHQNQCQPEPNSSVLVKRTHNIAALFDTPFKPADVSTVPPTPGIGVSTTTLHTPMPKSTEEMSAYLFGSISRGDLDTPLLSAITPGFRFTPFGSSGATPRSAPATDYSSGGSYYKPDETDDLDHKMDRVLKESTQKKISGHKKMPSPIKQSKCNPADAVGKDDKVGVASKARMETEQSDVCVEIPLEMVRVEPIVLKRVKSMTQENDSSTGPAIEPHYTLASGLPDTIVEDEASSSSASSSSSSSSSSSLSSNSSSSSSSSVSSPSVGSTKKEASPKAATTPTSCRANSSDDEEWQKLEMTDDDNPQLVNDDGEVRYPLRSWKTPSKDSKESEAGHKSKLVLRQTRSTVPLMHPNDQRRIELERKRQRVQERLRAEHHSTQTKELPKSSNTVPTRRGAKKVMIDRKAKQEDNEKRTIDVLTALNLSAKKKTSEAVIAPVQELRTKTTAVTLPVAIDDNAVSNVFCSMTTIKTGPSMLALPLPPKSGNRKCVQISARPLSMKKRVGMNAKGIKIDPKGLTGRTRSRLYDKSILAGKQAGAKGGRLSFEKKNEEAEPEAESKGKLSVEMKKEEAEPEAESKGKLRVEKKKEEAVAQSKGKSNSGKKKEESDAETETETEETKAGSRQPQTPSISPSARKSSRLEKVRLAASKLRTPAKAQPKMPLSRKTPTTRKKFTKNKEHVEVKESAAIRADSEERLTKEHDQVTKAESKQRLECAIDEMPKPEEWPTRKESSKSAKENEPIPDEMATSQRLAELDAATSIAVESSSNTDKNEHDKEAEVEANVVAVVEAEAEVVEKEKEENVIAAPLIAKDVESSDEDDTFADCELVTITEENKKCYHTFVYDDNKEPPNSSGKEADAIQKRPDFSKFKMIVNLDEHERHEWSISNDILLFASDPLPMPVINIPSIRNIPKKRKIRISTTMQGDEVDAAASPMEPAATSTPNPTMPASRLSSRTEGNEASDKDDVILENNEAKQKQTAAECSAESPSTSSAAVPDVADKIHFEDIETILSQLHGT